MKRIVLLISVLSIVLAGFSQVKLDYSAKPKSEAKGFSSKGLSSSSARFLYQLRQIETTADRSAKESMYAKLQSEYDIQQGRASAIIVLAAGKSSQDLSAYDVTVNTVSGEMVTAMIPVSRFAELAASGVCSMIDMGEKQHPMMDKARQYLGVDQIHAGINLPQGYDGTGVVVGVIDIGFEYCHPAFYDATGNTLRVKRVWNQKDTTGTAPDGFNYGSEYTTESQMMAAETDDASMSHGSHVTNIAAGCGAPTGDGAVFKGIAPCADIVLVPAVLRAANIMDAISYIHSYAQSVGKPCVINISLGDMCGPHDGTSLMDRFVTSLVAQHPDSLVIVTSAGNSGNSPDHIEKTFSPEDTLLITRPGIEHLRTFAAELELWGDKNYSVALALVNYNTEAQEDFTGFLTTGADTAIVVNLVASNNETLACHFKLSQRDSINHRYCINIQYDTVPHNCIMILTVRCDSVATVHAWSNLVSFISTPIVPGTVEGDSHYTMSGFGANSDAVISVGAYNTRLSYTTYTGYYQTTSSDYEMVNVAPFSSLGPTYDGRVKPDIVAPGHIIVSACNRFDATVGGMTIIYDTIVWNGQVENYTVKQGTSMSSPMVAGIVALWMQHNPSLGTDSARAILHRTAYNDRYTGDCVTTPNNTWGYGKVNAYGGLPANNTLWLLNAFESEDGTGCVEGGGVVTEGTHTLTANPATNHLFVSWDDGNTDNPRTVNVTCDTTFLAVFSPLGYDDCDTISDYPWTAEFDDNLTCWKLIDADGDGETWKKTSSVVTSLEITQSAMNTDNWLISPAFEVNQNLDVKVSIRCYNATGSQDFSLLLSTSGSEMSDFSTVLDTHTFTTVENREISVSLAEYQGQTVRIALRHHNSTGLLASMTLDGFTIDIGQDSVSVPSYAGFANYTLAIQGLQLNIAGAEGHSLQIFDLAGRLVVSSPTADGHYRLPSSGIYILRVDGFPPRKVVVMP